MTEDERTLGRLEAQMDGLENRMDALEERVAEVRADVHEIKESVAEMRGNVKLLLERDQNSGKLFAFLILLFAAAGLYYGRISEWGLIVSLFIAGVVSQHGSLNRLAATIFRRREDARAESTTA